MQLLPELTNHYVDPNTYPQGVAFMDGQYMEMKHARISVLDYGLLHSDATYDVAHVWNGAFFRIGDHIARFRAGMTKLHMKIDYSDAEIVKILQNCVALSGLKHAYVEFICTRGTSPTFSRDPRDAVNKFIAFAIPFGSVANKDQMERGLDVAISDKVRIPPASLDPTIKNYHWLDLVTGLYDAYAQGAETAVLLDTDGNIAEGPGFNIFVVKDGQITTPEHGVLMGITRQTIIELCAKVQNSYQIGPVSKSALLDADEVFVTSTAGGVMPVTRVDGTSIGSGAVGEVTTQIKDLYWQLHEHEDYRLVIDYQD